MGVCSLLRYLGESKEKPVSLPSIQTAKPFYIAEGFGRIFWSILKRVLIWGVKDSRVRWDEKRVCQFLFSGVI
jgi:hypothetical protein